MASRCGCPPPLPSRRSRLTPSRENDPPPPPPVAPPSSEPAVLSCEQLSPDHLVPLTTRFPCTGRRQSGADVHFGAPQRLETTTPTVREMSDYGNRIEWYRDAREHLVVVSTTVTTSERDGDGGASLSLSILFPEFESVCRDDSESRRGGVLVDILSFVPFRSLTHSIVRVCKTLSEAVPIAIRQRGGLTVLEFALACPVGAPGVDRSLFFRVCRGEFCALQEGEETCESFRWFFYSEHHDEEESELVLQTPVTYAFLAGFVSEDGPPDEVMSDLLRTMLRRSIGAYPDFVAPFRRAVQEIVVVNRAAMEIISACPELVSCYFLSIGAVVRNRELPEEEEWRGRREQRSPDPPAETLSVCSRPDPSQVPDDVKEEREEREQRAVATLRVLVEGLRRHNGMDWRGLPFMLSLALVSCHFGCARVLFEEKDNFQMWLSDNAVVVGLARGRSTFPLDLFTSLLDFRGTKVFNSAKLLRAAMIVAEDGGNSDYLNYLIRKGSPHTEFIEHIFQEKSAVLGDVTPGQFRALVKAKPKLKTGRWKDILLSVVPKGEAVFVEILTERE